MLDAEHIDEWMEENADAINAATDFFDQIQKGLQPERFMPTLRMRLIGKGIGALLQIIDMQTQVLDAMEDEEDAD